MKQLIIIGGGLAGLINAILASRKGWEVTLYEKKKYPFHKVCGEYVSNEVVPFLRQNDLYPAHLALPGIRKFQFTSLTGKSLEMNLDLGGFGISRFVLDHFLVSKARESGATIVERKAVTHVEYRQGIFRVGLSDGSEDLSLLVIGAYGKNGTLDKKLDRLFTRHRSPFIGVKYHLRTDFPKDRVALHNFEGGYCGISAIEQGKYNLCYLGKRETLRKYGNINAMEEAVLKKNPFLKQLFENSDFIFERPEVINQFSFRPKTPVEHHILMSGDTAGLITPLCGNGMAMAIHSAKILSDIISTHYINDRFDLPAIEKHYTRQWRAAFKRRLWAGRKIQRLFGSKLTSELAVRTLSNFRWLARQVMKNTHGRPF